MIILSRKVGQSIVVADEVTIKLISVRPGRVKFAIEAPDGISVVRGEAPVPSSKEVESRSLEDSINLTGSGDTLKVKPLKLPGSRINSAR